MVIGKFANVEPSCCQLENLAFARNLPLVSTPGGKLPGRLGLPKHMVGMGEGSFAARVKSTGGNIGYDAHCQHVCIVANFWSMRYIGEILYRNKFA